MLSVVRKHGFITEGTEGTEREGFCNDGSEGGRLFWWGECPHEPVVSSKIQARLDGVSPHPTPSGVAVVAAVVVKMLCVLCALCGEGT